MCGWNTGTIENCYNTGDVSGTSEYGFVNAGGVCGLNDYGTIENCYNTGEVSGIYGFVYAGGVCGINNKLVVDGIIGTIKNCYNTGEVSGENAEKLYVGGVCGFNYKVEFTTIENCYFLYGTAVNALGNNGDTIDKVEEKSAEAFASGEVAWLLNNGAVDGTQAFYQTCGVGLPQFSGETVYKVKKFKCPYDSIGTYIYSNTDKNVTGEHSYGEPEWNWSEDGKTCTVTFTCENNPEHKETLEADVTTEVKTPATCTEIGVTTYTGTVEFNGQTYKDMKDVSDLAATGHSYGEPEWNWSEDGKTCTVTFTCANDETHKESPNVTVTSAVKMPATCTEIGVTTYMATVKFNGQTYTDTKDVADIPAIGHSYEDGKCTVCGEIDPDFKAVIIEGANGEWQKGTKDGLSFTSNAAFAHFQKVQVDGKDLDASNYTVKEGSTIVTLKTSYLETLSVGKHTLAIVSETGTATTEFTIKAAVTDDTQSPQTGDNSNMVLWIALLFVSGGVLSMMFVINKRKIAKNR